MSVVQNFDCGDESKKDDESLHEAYKKMYGQWLKVCASNCALNGEIHVLRDSMRKPKVKFLNWKHCLLRKLRLLRQSLLNLRENSEINKIT